MSWLDLWSKEKCEECPSVPKPNLVGYPKAFFTNDLFEYGAGRNVTKELGKEQGVWTIQDLEKYGYRYPSEQTPYVGKQKYYDEKYEIDCYWLVQDTLLANGYHGMGSNLPIMPESWTFPSKYFCKIEDYSKVAPGDIVATTGHLSFYDIDPNTGVTSLFSAQDPVSDIGSKLFSFAFESDRKKVLGVYRPRECWEVNSKDPDKSAALTYHKRDPLILDLDGNGIQTLGLSAGIHFDDDHNGFKEATGWVAPGDGMLMLDLNGNGRLDSGKELFGNFMILPNGVKVGNGFEALAYYDANGDGKIDSADPIWSQLKVWQHIDYDSDTLNTNTSTGYTYFLSQSSSGCG